MDEGTKQKLEIFVLRMTGFSVVVLIPQLTQLCLKFHEANQSDTWEKKFYGDNCDNLFVPCLSDEEAETLSAPSALFIVSKYIFLLLPALAPLTWIANGKIALASISEISEIFEIQKNWLHLTLEFRKNDPWLENEFKCINIDVIVVCKIKSLSR